MCAFLTAAVGSATDAAHASSETGGDKRRRSLASFLSSKYGVTFIDPIEGAAGLVHHESDWSTTVDAGSGSGAPAAAPSPPVVPGAGVPYTGSAFTTPQRHRRTRRSTRASVGQLGGVGSATAPVEGDEQDPAAPTDGPSSTPVAASGTSSRRRLEEKRVAARRSRLSKRLSSGPAPPNAVAVGVDGSRGDSVSPPVGNVVV